MRRITTKALWMLPLVMGISSGSLWANPENRAGITVSQPAPVDRRVTGTVVDETGEGLPGVSVAVKGTTRGTTTDVNGKFELQIPDNAATLVFSFTGYLSQEIAIGNQSAFQVNMKLDTKTLEEVVVVGYGAVKRSDLTASVASVKSEQIKAFPTQSVDQALTARATGINVTQASGAPGGGSTVRIRGSNSISSGSEPLYVIDGFPVYSDNAAASAGGDRVASNVLATLNPNDIESIEILKDASGTSIYGSRGSNGVVLITTKRGKAGQTRVNYESSHSVQTIARRIDMMNASEYAQFQNQRAISRGQSIPFPNPASLGEGVNWLDETSRNGSIINHNLTFSGGNDKSQFLVAGGYFKNNGIIKNTDFERFSLRTNIDSRFFNDKVRLGVSTTLNRTSSNAIPTDRGGPGGAIITILGQSPIGPVFEQDGSYRFEPYDGRFPTNPLAEVMEIIDTDRGIRFLGNTYVQWEVAKNLFFKTSIGVDLLSNSRETYYSDLTRLGRERGRSYEIGNRNITNLLNENTLNYSKTIGSNQRIDALVGYTYQQDDNRFGGVQSNQFAFNDFNVNNIQNGVDFRRPFTSKTQWTLQSFLARVNYSLMDKYLVTLTARRDGSSRFGANNKWATFPSAAFKWKIKEESFLQDVDGISDLGFRVSYGVTGNSELPIGRSLASLNTGAYLFNNQLVPVVFQNRPPNPDLRWESTAMFNIGLDLALFNNKLKITTDYFNNNTRDLLLEVALAPSSGFSRALQNAGSLQNQGFEFSADWVAIDKKDLRWDINFNASTLKNVVTSLAGTPPFYSYVGSHLGPEGSYIAEGLPIGGWYGYKYIGIWQSADEIANNPSIRGIDKPGYPRYEDVNGDGVIDIGDRTFLGDPNPRFIWGFNSKVTYKRFDFTLFFRGAHGQKVRNLQASEHADGVGNYNQYRSVFTDSWSTSNPNGTRPIIDATREFPSFFRRSSFFIEDGSFIRLQNLAIGYTLPKIKGIENARVYVSGQNLLLFTKYTGWDPEVSNGGQSALNRGDDYDAYPRPRTFTAGVNFTF
ncbi:MAG: SusC/RagA family TonB-linked outer membrane protein [Spirosomataceae bacterium]